VFFHEAGARASAGERTLRVEHRDEPGAVVNRGAEVGWSEDRGEGRQSAKNVVCPGP
jgi:hypothetical protein